MMIYRSNSFPRRPPGTTMFSCYWDHGEVIVSCRIVSPRSFARMELSETVIHGSAFGIAINDEKMEPRLFLLYLNSKHFWRQLDSTMPPMGVGRRAVRISLLKDLIIPHSIAFPDGQHVAEARVSYRASGSGIRGWPTLSLGSWTPSLRRSSRRRGKKQVIGRTHFRGETGQKPS